MMRELPRLVPGLVTYRIETSSQNAQTLSASRQRTALQTRSPPPTPGYAP
jgi:hypothetical protein